MRPNDFTPIVIIALNQDRIELDQGILQARLSLPTPPDACEGVYKSEKESSYIIPLVHGRTIEQLSQLATEYDQESILYSDNQRNSWLVYANGTREYIGELKQVQGSVARDLDAYTYLPKSDTYLICQ